MQDALSPHATASLTQSNAPAQATRWRPAVRQNTRPAAGPRLSSTDLLGNALEVEIQHGEALYRLRLTALGKLILTK